MDKKMMIIIGGIIVAIAVVAAFMLFSPSNDSGYSKIDIIGDGTVPENGTLNVKLENGQNIALKDKNVTIILKNSKGKVVFQKTVKTFVNGVANVRLTNVSAGEYDVNATFAGDENYTASSVSEKIKIVAGESEDTNDDTADENMTADVVDDTTTQTSDSSSSYSSQSSSSSSSYSPSSSSSSSYSSSSSSSSSSESSDNTVHYTDENGNAAEGYIDENGNEVYDDF